MTGNANFMTRGDKKVTAQRNVRYHLKADTGRCILAAHFLVDRISGTAQKTL